MYNPTELDARDWRISISGEVDKPLTLSLADQLKILLTIASTTDSPIVGILISTFMEYLLHDLI